MRENLSPEKALGLYAEKVQASDIIDLKYFEERMTADDYAEFLELIPIVDAVKASKEKDKFDKMFGNIKRNSDTEFGGDFAMAAGFRSANNKAVPQETLDIVNKIFDEVFGDDE